MRKKRRDTHNFKLAKMKSGTLLKLGKLNLWRGAQLMSRKSCKPVQQNMYLSKETKRSDLLKPHTNTLRLRTNGTERIDSI